MSVIRKNARKNRGLLLLLAITGRSYRKGALGDNPVVQMEPAGKKHKCLETEDVAEKPWRLSKGPIWSFRLRQRFSK